MTAMNANVRNAINTQVNAEFNSAYSYLAMSAYCQERNLPGCAHWLKLQWQEELDHAMKLIGHLQSRGEAVEFGSISSGSKNYSTITEVFETVLKHEQAITASINSLYELSISEKDHPLNILLQWFITEQVEEESSVSEIIERLKMVGESGTSLVLLDRQLAMRGR